MEHNKPNWDKLQAVSVLTPDSPKLGPALKKNPFINNMNKAKLLSVLLNTRLGNQGNEDSQQHRA